MILEWIASKATVYVAKKAAGAAIDSYKEFKKTAEERAADQIDATQPCEQTKEQRVRARQQAIKSAEAKLNDPSLPADQRKELAKATERFKTNNQAVEYAKLSDHSYDQYDPYLKGRAPSGPPEGWEVVSPESLGLSKANLEPPAPSTFKAVVYKNKFGMEPEYTVAFRGTEPKDGQNDINVDVENAAGRETKSYSAAVKLMQKLSEAQEAGKMGKFAVTGHSLGGGLAQTAAMKIRQPPDNARPLGFMFNSAGAHPRVVGSAVDGSTFQQFRSPCDPLTAISGTQDGSVVADALQLTARAIQTTTRGAQKVGQFLGLAEGDDDKTKRYEDSAEKVAVSSIAARVAQADGGIAGNKEKFGWYVPPNAGTMHAVSSCDSDGKEVPCSSVGDQHSITNLVNGMERDKTVDMLVMEKYDCTPKKIGSGVSGSW